MIPDYASCFSVSTVMTILYLVPLVFLFCVFNHLVFSVIGHLRF